MPRASPALVPTTLPPASAPRSGAGGAAATAVAPPKPKLPSSPQDKSAVNVSDLMHGIIAYNSYHLREKLRSNSTTFFTQFADLQLHEHKPLDITGDETGTTLSSYKHPWNQAEALKALKSTDCYEA